jgi:hypothetical protein
VKGGGGMFENKVIVNLVLLFTFIGAAVGSVTLFKITTQSEAFLITTSPKGTYTVRLTGQKDRPKVLFVTHQVLFSVSEGEKVLLANEYLHSGDWLDPSFDLSYPEHTWVSDDILQFYKKKFFDEGQHKSIVVINKTKEMIQYLRVTSVDTFLLFGVRPESTTTLTVSPPRRDSEWIEVEGEFLGGRRIKGDGVAFLIPKGKNGPFAYYVYINENSLTIESPDLEKYKAVD